MRWKEWLVLLGLLMFVSFPFIWSAVIGKLRKSKTAGDESPQSASRVEKP